MSGIGNVAANFLDLAGFENYPNSKRTENLLQNMIKLIASGNCANENASMWPYFLLFNQILTLWPTNHSE